VNSDRNRHNPAHFFEAPNVQLVGRLAEPAPYSQGLAFANPRILLKTKNFYAIGFARATLSIVLPGNVVYTQEVV
jgi:hypothetical protein